MKRERKLLPEMPMMKKPRRSIVISNLDKIY